MICYSAYAVDSSIRFMATSGGVGTALLKTLFDKYPDVSSISFEFDPTSLQYRPRIIHSFSEYVVTGSIYHEIDLCKFISDNIAEIRGVFCCFALPCQVRRIQNLLKKNGIPHLIFGLACSGSQSIEATYFLLKELQILLDNVIQIRYRGGGWPGGIKIQLRTGQEITCPNNNSIWEKIFHSKLFIQPRCFYCNQTISNSADIFLADPWLPEFINQERNGISLVAINTTSGNDLFKSSISEKNIAAKKISRKKMFNSQKGTILKKAYYSTHRIIPRILLSLVNNGNYRNLVLKRKKMFLFHCYLVHFIDRGIYFFQRRKQKQIFRNKEL